MPRLRIDNSRLTTQIRKYSPPVPVNTRGRSRPPAPGGAPPGAGTPGPRSIPPARVRSGEPVENLAGRADDALDVLALEDQRRRHREGIARVAHQDAGLEQADHGLVGP